MSNTLHLLRSAPDEIVADLIATLSGKEGTTVVILYPDDIAATPVDWDRLIEDIMAHDKIICWW